MRLPSWPSHGRRGPAGRLAVQYFKFGLVGVVATVTYVGLFAGLIELAGLAPLLANFVAFPTALGVSFVGHHGWTFAPDRKRGAAPPRVRRAFVKFFIVALIGLGLNSVVVYVVTESLALSYLYAIVLMVTVVPIVVFLLNKYWAFRAPDP